MWAVIDQSVDRNTVDAKVEFGGNGTIMYATVVKKS